MTKALNFRGIVCVLSLACCSFTHGDNNHAASATDATKHDYIVAAYVWPSCHDEPMSREALWGEGIGEWEIVKKAEPRFDGHYQPRVPLWGYRPVKKM